MKQYVRDAVPALYPAILFGPNRAKREEAKRLLYEIRRETGEFSMRERLLGLATIGLSFWTWLISKLNIFQQPKLLRIQYPSTYTCGDQSDEMEPNKLIPINLKSISGSSPQYSFTAESERKS
jgi:hypothetical protein